MKLRIETPFLQAEGRRLLSDLTDKTNELVAGSQQNDNACCELFGRKTTGENKEIKRAAKGEGDKNNKKVEATLSVLNDLKSKYNNGFTLPSQAAGLPCGIQQEKQSVEPGKYFSRTLILPNDESLPLTAPGKRMPSQYHECRFPGCRTAVVKETRDLTQCETHSHRLHQALPSIQATFRTDLQPSVQSPFALFEEAKESMSNPTTRQILYGPMQTAIVIAMNEFKPKSDCSHSEAKVTSAFYEALQAARAGILLYRMYLNPDWSAIGDAILVACRWLLANGQVIIDAIRKMHEIVASVDAVVWTTLERLAITLGSHLAAFLTAIFGYFSVFVDFAGTAALEGAAVWGVSHVVVGVVAALLSIAVFTLISYGVFRLVSWLRYPKEPPIQVVVQGGIVRVSPMRV